MPPASPTPASPAPASPAPASPRPPTPALATARPRPAAPYVVLATAALLAALTGAALAQRAPAFAALLALAALVPWTGSERLRGLGIALAWGGVIFGVVAIARVPLGARVTALYVPTIAALAARAWALRSEAARRWADPRWALGVTAPIRPLERALAAALRAPPEDHAAVDAAVVALATAPAGAVPEVEADRRAFWINTYNVLARHAGRGRASPRVLDALEVFRTTYRVAGVPLTVDDIEHGLLRDGAAPPGAPWARMGRGDPRRRWAVPRDGRIHFAVNCGALSCPPVRVYRGDALEEQLDTAERSFLAAESAIDEAAGVVETSRLLAWYAADLGGERGVRARIARALEVDEARVARLRLRYRAYDWTSAI